MIDAGFRDDDVVGEQVSGLVGQVGVGFVDQGLTGRQVRRFERGLQDTRVTAVLHLDFYYNKKKKLDC